MLEIILLSTFVIIFGIIIYKEYKDTKRYNEERSKYRKKSTPVSSKKTTLQPTEKKEKQPSKKVSETQKPSISKPQTVPQEEKAIEEIKTIELPVCDYPPFDHSRTIAMGLSEEEAIEFMQELILQIETQIPLIEEQLQVPDFHKIERLTHSIKGSATNLGTGSVSDLLVEYNTYLKTGTDLQIAEAYFECLKVYAQKLKQQYS